jgi:hypothetical protein
MGHRENLPRFRAKARFALVHIVDMSSAATLA